mgnify:CR=1 FL=1
MAGHPGWWGMAARRCEGWSRWNAAVRALNRMHRAGFAMHLNGSDLVVSPFSRLTAAQRAFIRAHKPALVALLSDAEALHRSLIEAGPDGLDWREGTPDWSDDRLLAAGEVLYAGGRMVNVLGRRYCPASAPSIEEGPEYPPAAEVAEIASCAAVAP